MQSERDRRDRGPVLCQEDGCACACFPEWAAESVLSILRETLKRLRPPALFPSSASELHLHLAFRPIQPELFPCLFVLGEAEQTQL